MNDPTELRDVLARYGVEHALVAAYSPSGGCAHHPIAVSREFYASTAFFDAVRCLDPILAIGACPVVLQHLLVMYPLSTSIAFSSSTNIPIVGRYSELKDLPLEQTAAIVREGNDLVIWTSDRHYTLGVKLVEIVHHLCGQLHEITSQLTSIHSSSEKVETNDQPGSFDLLLSGHGVYPDSRTLSDPYLHRTPDVVVEDDVRALDSEYLSLGECWTSDPTMPIDSASPFLGSVPKALFYDISQDLSSQSYSPFSSSSESSLYTSPSSSTSSFSPKSPPLNVGDPIVTVNPADVCSVQPESPALWADSLDELEIDDDESLHIPECSEWHGVSALVELEDVPTPIDFEQQDASPAPLDSPSEVWSPDTSAPSVPPPRIGYKKAQSALASPSNADRPLKPLPRNTRGTKGKRPTARSAPSSPLPKKPAARAAAPPRSSTKESAPSQSSTSVSMRTPLRTSTPSSSNATRAVGQKAKRDAAEYAESGNSDTDEDEDGDYQICCGDDSDDEDYHLGSQTKCNKRRRTSTSSHAVPAKGVKKTGKTQKAPSREKEKVPSVCVFCNVETVRFGDLLRHVKSACMDFRAKQYEEWHLCPYPCKQELTAEQVEKMQRADASNWLRKKKKLAEQGKITKKPSIEEYVETVDSNGNKMYTRRTTFSRIDACRRHMETVHAKDGKYKKGDQPILIAAELEYTGEVHIALAAAQKAQQGSLS